MQARVETTRPSTRLVVLATMLLMAACSESTTGLDDSPPEVVVLNATAVSGFDENQHSPRCFKTAGAPNEASTTCPVVRWMGRDYWAFSFGDNRSSFAIHVYDANGNLLGVEERVGARYLYAIEIDVTAETVTFRGQSDNTVTMAWAELASVP